MSDEIPAAVPGDTDDLSAFESVFHGKAPEVKAEVDTTEEVEDNAEAVEGQDDEADKADEVSADDEDAGEEQEEAPEEAPKPLKKKNSAQERIDELTAARKTAERAAEEQLQRNNALEQRLRELEASRPEPQKTLDPPAVEATGPKPDDVSADGTEKYPLGELDPAFIRDLTRFTIKQEQANAQKEANERAQAAQMEQYRQELNTEYRKKADAFKAEATDFDAQVKVLEGTFGGINPSYGDYLASTVMSMDHGPEVLYYLSQNLPEARKIVESGAVKATIALGRLEARFADKQSSAPVKVTQARTPPKPVRGSGGKFSVAPDTDDLDAFEKQFYTKK